MRHHSEEVMAATVSVGLAAVMGSLAGQDRDSSTVLLTSLLAPSFAYGLWISRVTADAASHSACPVAATSNSNGQSEKEQQAAELCNACTAHFDVATRPGTAAAAPAEECVLCVHRETAEWEDRAVSPLSLSEADALSSDSDSSDGDSDDDQDADADSVCSSSSSSSGSDTDDDDGAFEDPLSTWRSQMLVILDPPELRGREKRVWLNKVHQRLNSRLVKNLHPERASTKLPSTFSRSRLFRCTGPDTPLFKDF